MWWLGLALFLICIIEVCSPQSLQVSAQHYVQRDGLDKEATSSSIFTVRKPYPYLLQVEVNPHRFSVFEIVSAYGTLGPFLGIPDVR